MVKRKKKKRSLISIIDEYSIINSLIGYDQTTDKARRPAIMAVRPVPLDWPSKYGLMSHFKSFSRGISWLIEPSICIEL